ncbi:MAG TPA: hypothetical protein VHW66_09360 [Stellaceae bacterium]|jgi:hypothetical protein|nr:hypothetical protein [Stellaceae bacterium]
MPHIGTLAVMLARNAGQTIQRSVVDQAKAIGWGNVERMLRRSAVGEITTSFSAPAGTETELNAFITSLRGQSLAVEVAARAQHFPLHSRVGILPESGFAAAEIGEFQPAATVLLTNGVVTITSEKVSCVLAYSAELLATNGAAAAIEADLQKAIGRGLDRALISRIAPGSSSGFAATSSALADIKTLVGMLAVTGAEPLVAGAAIDVNLTAAALMQDGGEAFPEVNFVGMGMIKGIPWIPTDQISAGSLLLVDPSGLQCTIEGIEIVAGTSATLVMDSAPTMPNELVDMFATSSVAIRATATFSMQVLRGTDVSAECTEIAWASS